jgi:hypothetical protein
MAMCRGFCASLFCVFGVLFLGGYALFFCGGLLYFRGVFGGRVRVACRLLYSIFRVGRGLLYFRGCFW